MKLNEWRERANLWLYGNKELVLSLLQILTVLVAVGSLGCLVYLYGFPLNEDQRALTMSVIQGSFAFYILRYIIRYVYDFEPRKFFRRTWLEGLIVLLLIIEGLSYQITGGLILKGLFVRLGLEHFSEYSIFFIQGYVLLVVIVDIISSPGKILPNLKFHPSTIFIGSFLFLIFIGTGLLMLPEMSNIQGGMSFLDALFMSSSATCVTGLATVDVAYDLTFKGHWVLLILVKLGGLNIIAFGSFIALVSRFGIGVKQHDVLEDFINRDSVISAKGMLGKVVIWSTAIELAGAVAMYAFWNPDIPWKGEGDKVFSSLFHSVSAFNNAGLSLFENGLYNDMVQHNYGIHLVVTFLVFWGALGFMAIFDMFDPKNLRRRLKQPWRSYSFSTKIALYFSVGLVLVGTLFYYVLEKDNTLADKGVIGGLITSLFQSVTRTSGFNTVDIGSIGLPMLLILVVLMFIGSSSSSTGGGIKTSSFALIYASIVSTVRGHKNVELFKRTISNELVYRAFSVLLFFIVGNLVCIFVLTITEQAILQQEGRDIMDLIFEEVSAMGTVGLSTGITADLSPAGKVTIILSMLIGRVGTLTVAFIFGRPLLSKNYKYPQGHTMVG